MIQYCPSVVVSLPLTGWMTVMFKLYSKGCEYTLRVLAQLPADDPQQGFLASEYCERAGVPEPSTRKMLQKLVHRGYLVATRGPGGGYRLTTPPDQISLLDLILAVDGDTSFDQCIMGLPTCGGDSPCPIHETWFRTKCHLLNQLGRVTLADLIENASADAKHE